MGQERAPKTLAGEFFIKKQSAERTTIQLEQKSGEMETALAEEKAAKDRMGADLSTRQAAIAELQKQLGAARSAHQKLEIDIQNTQRENARLQSQIPEVQAQQPARRQRPLQHEGRR
jgi:chromosome segregation ATPase